MSFVINPSLALRTPSAPFGRRQRGTREKNATALEAIAAGQAREQAQRHCDVCGGIALRLYPIAGRKLSPRCKRHFIK